MSPSSRGQAAASGERPLSSSAEPGSTWSSRREPARRGEGRDDSDTSRGELALPGSVEGTARDVRATGAQALPIVLDMGDRAAIERAVHDVEEAWGRIDILVNNAVQLEGNLAVFSI